MPNYNFVIDPETVALGGQECPVRGPGGGMTSRCPSPSKAAVACYGRWIKSWGSTTEPPVRKLLDKKKDKVYSPSQNLSEDGRLPRASVL